MASEKDGQFPLNVASLLKHLDEIRLLLFDKKNG
jgi:hypothetical protein